MNIIFPGDNYTAALTIAGVDTLDKGHNDASKKFEVVVMRSLGGSSLDTCWTRNPAFTTGYLLPRTEARREHHWQTEKKSNIRKR